MLFTKCVSGTRLENSYFTVSWGGGGGGGGGGGAGGESVPTLKRSRNTDRHQF